MNETEIGVTAKDGIVTLSGTVDSFWKKSQAEEAAKNTAGVKAVVEKIEVKPGNGSFKKEDSEIAAEVLNAFKWNLVVPSDKIKIKVEKGWVTLDGELQWNYQREAARNAVSNLLGVTGVSNNIKIKSVTQDEIEKKDIESALARNWSLQDLDIQVKVSGTKVTLTGNVESWYQKNEAGRIAWNAPGALSVDNELIIDYQFELAD